MAPLGVRRATRARAAPFFATAIVLHLGNTGDSHRMVEMLCAQRGKLVAIARGARASKKRFAGILDVFATLGLQLQGSSGLHTLLQADAQSLRLGIRQNFHAIVRAQAFCQCVRALVPPEQPVQEVYAALTTALDLLDAGAVVRSASCYPQLLAAAGLLPEVRCQSCGVRPPNAPLGLSRRDGALSCARCQPGVQALLPEVLTALHQAPHQAPHPAVQKELHQAPAQATPSFGELTEAGAQALEACALTMVGLHRGRALVLPDYT
jgi:DNA repair protein RecO (recombination protein O)